MLKRGIARRAGPGIVLPNYLYARIVERAREREGRVVASVIDDDQLPFPIGLAQD